MKKTPMNPPDEKGGLKEQLHVTMQFLPILFPDSPPPWEWTVILNFTFILSLFSLLHSVFTIAFTYITKGRTFQLFLTFYERCHVLLQFVFYCYTFVLFPGSCQCEQDYSEHSCAYLPWLMGKAQSINIGVALLVSKAYDCSTLTYKIILFSQWFHQCTGK